MKKLFLIISLCLVLLLSGCGSSGETSSGAGYEQITAEEAKNYMDTEDDFIILDVRTDEEFEEGHIPGAILIPDYDIAKKAEESLPDKEQLILVYCRSGNRSKVASNDLAELGYTNVKEFGGINDWPYEVVKGTALSYWEQFETVNVLGKTKSEIESIFTSLECGTDTDIESYFKTSTDMGVYDTDRFYVDQNTGNAVKFGGYSGLDSSKCDTVGGTAYDIFGLTEAQDMSAFIKDLGAYISDAEIYSPIIRTDNTDNFWWTYKSDMGTIKIDGGEYIYMIKVYTEGIQGVKEGEAPDKDVITPNTPVAISLITYGMGY